MFLHLVKTKVSVILTGMFGDSEIWNKIEATSPTVCYEKLVSPLSPFISDMQN